MGEDMTYPSTLLVQNNSPEEIRKADLDLLKKINEQSTALNKRVDEVYNSPSFTGTPTAPTAPVGTDTEQLATTAFVQDAVGKTVTITGNYTVAEDEETVLVDTNSAISVTIPDGLPIGKKIEITRISTGLTTNAVTIIMSGSDLLQGLATFAVFGNSIAKTTKYKEIFVIEKISATAWRFLSGLDSGANANGSYKKYFDGTAEVTAYNSVTFTTTTLSAPIAVTGVLSKTLPTTFIDTQYYSSAVSEGLAWTGGTATGKSTTIMTYALYTVNAQTGQTRNIAFFCSGRWY